MVNGTAWTIAAVAALLTVMSGVAGVAVGGVSAAAGWWLIVIGGVLFVGLLATRNRRTT